MTTHIARALATIAQGGGRRLAPPGGAPSRKAKKRRVVFWMLGAGARRAARLLRLPAARIRLLLVHPVRPGDPAAMDRPRNYEYLFTKDPKVWIAAGNTLWFVVIMVPVASSPR